MKAIMTRKEFTRMLSLAALSTAMKPLISGCGSPVALDPEQQDQRYGTARRQPVRFQGHDIVLSGDEYQMASEIKPLYVRLYEMAEDPAKRFRMAFPVGSNTEILEIAMATGGAARYRHVRVVRETTGEAVNLVWGREGVYPSIKLADDSGRTIIKDARPLEFSFGLARREGTGPRSWLELGIQIAAIALLVWLGASILKPIVAAIAFIAFNAMVIGIAIAGVSLFVALVQWILNVTGWTMEEGRAMFERSIEEIAQSLREVTENLR